MKIQVLFFAMMLPIVSCGDQSADNEPDAAQAVEKAQQADPAPKSEVTQSVQGVKQVRRKTEDIELHDDRESQLGTMTMDGSSEAAFEASLKQLQETAPTAEYRSVKSAIQYLLVYDLNARGNKAKLYEKLDGKTPEEIIALAKR